MLFLTRLIMHEPSLHSPTVLLITDRSDLDDQLSRQFLNSKKFIGDNTIIEMELPQLRKLDVGNIRKVKSLLGILSSGVPYTVDTVKLSSMAEMSRNTLLQYLQNLSEARLIQLLYSDVTNVKRLQKPDKIYMENTNMLHALSATQVNEGTEREVFFINQLSAAHVVEYSKTSADFTIDHQYTIEVGGRSKDGKQIAGVANSFIASAVEEMCWGTRFHSGSLVFCISIAITKPDTWAMVPDTL